MLTPELVTVMLADISHGVPVRQACVEWGVNPRAFYAQMQADEGLQQRYGAAKRMAVEPLVDRAIEIAEDKTIAPQDKRVRIDAIKWYAGKLAPKLYGDKIEIEHRGAVDLLGELNRRETTA